ncbi:hypothetical protein [Altericista sp. CCNU0014]|uniref:hypothetical protein n=1 Tax=Altericista sp. CCNU0014 TaxID=3082949 RepID=UPI003850A82E
MNKSIIFLGFLIFLILDAEPAKGAFRKILASRTENCSVRLPRIEQIPYRCVRWVDETAKLPFWRNSLGFQFGRLSRSQWQILTQTYAAWHNAKLLAPYNPQQNYELLDFMPPTLQALDRHRFYAQARMLDARRSSSPKIQLATNCWGTVYEVLRLARRPSVESPVLFATAAQPMLETLRAISTPANDQQPGDILLLSHRHGQREYLDHVVSIVDRGLFFEKAGTGDEVPYRFVAADTLTQIWNPAIFRYEVRRPLANVALPPPSDRFSLKQQPVLELPLPELGRWRSHLTVVEDADAPPTLLWMQTLPPLERTLGRYRLPPAAYRAAELWPNPQ